MMPKLNASNAVAALLCAALLLLPAYSAVTGNIFILTLFTRIVIFALAAASLNLIMGYGGMMSFGHAAYLGIGGYAVGILAAEGIGSGFIQWPVALVVSALFALVIGALSLRTRGVYFIMITLAFVWNEFLFALFLTNSRWQTLPILVAGQNSQRGDEWWAISAAALVAIVPMMIMAGLLSRMMRSGLLLGAIK